MPPPPALLPETPFFHQRQRLMAQRTKQKPSKDHSGLVLSVLLSRLDPNAALHPAGITPLMAAAEMGDVGLVDDLLARGADPTASIGAWIPPGPDRRGWAALHMAATAAVADRLLDGGANPYAYTTSGMGALLHAAAGLMGPLVARLLRMGVDVEGHPQAPTSPLWEACRASGGSEDQGLVCVDLLLLAGAQVNRSFEHGDTLLHEAVQNRKVAVVRRLLDAGAQEAPNQAGQWPRDRVKAGDPGWQGTDRARWAAQGQACLALLSEARLARKLNRCPPEKARARM